MLVFSGEWYNASMETTTERKVFIPDLTQSREKRFIINDFMMANTVSLMSAPPNTGKTSLAMHIARCVTLGNDFFGMQVANKTKCLFLQYDMDEMQHADYNALYAPDCPLPMVNGYELLIAKDGRAQYDFFDLLKPDNASWLVRYCKENGIGVLFIDTLSSAFPNYEENSNNQMGKAIGTLKMIAHQGLAITALHHMSKSEGGYSNTSRGASSIVAGVDAEYKLKRSSNGVISVDNSKCRFGKTGHLFDFVIGEDGIYQPDALPAGEDDKPLDYTNLKKCFSGEEWLSRIQIKSRTGHGNTFLKRLLDGAVEDLVLERKEGNAHHYKLKENSC